MIDFLLLPFHSGRKSVHSAADAADTAPVPYAENTAQEGTTRGSGRKGRNGGRGENREPGVLRTLFGFLPLRIICWFTAVSLIVALLSLFSRSFAEFYSRTAGSAVRCFLAKLTGIFPLSLAETLLFALLVFILYTIGRAIIDAIRKTPPEKRFGVVADRVLLCFALSAYALYNFGFVSCNRRVSLADNLGLSRAPLTAEDLYDCTLIVENEIADCLQSGEIRFSPSMASCMPYSYETLNDTLNAAYRSAYERYDFLSRFDSRVKRLAISPLMTYTHISGIYIPYTGEVNINTNYPDYVIAFSEAHEMAHQRGIAREDEANFTAFLVMYESDDVYLRYCALAELFDYLFDALFSADETLFFRAMSYCDRRLLGEMYAFASFFEPYASSAASGVTDVVNDVSIRLRGDAKGAKSYDSMIELAAAYFRRRLSTTETVS